MVWSTNKKAGGRAGAVKGEDLRFLLGLTRMGEIKNEYMKGSAQTEVATKDDKDGAARYEEKRKTREEILRCSEREHGECQCDRGGCYRQGEMKGDDPLW